MRKLMALWRFVWCPQTVREEIRMEPRPGGGYNATQHVLPVVRSRREMWAARWQNLRDLRPTVARAPRVLWGETQVRCQVLVHRRGGYVPMMRRVVGRFVVETPAL